MSSVAERLVGKVAIVTGAGQGLGLAIAGVLGDAGASVALLGRTESKLTQAVDEMRSCGATALAIRCDVADREDAHAAVAATLGAFGGVDVLINNAQGGNLGVSVPTGDVGDDELLEFMRTGPLGSLHMMQACFSTMRDGGGGAVVNMGSAVGVRGTPGMVGYAMAKEAINGLTKVTANEWGTHNIRVNQVCPAGLSAAAAAYLDADPVRAKALVRDIPLGRLGDPCDDIARAILALVSDDMKYLTGATIMLDGGYVIQR